MSVQIDKTRWAPAQDIKGNPVKPGDLVSCPAYPRGTIRGVLELSERAWCVQDGQNIGCLVIRLKDGKTYSATSKIRLLKK